MLGWSYVAIRIAGNNYSLTSGFQGWVTGWNASIDDGLNCFFDQGSPSDLSVVSETRAKIKAGLGLSPDSANPILPALAGDLITCLRRFSIESHFCTTAISKEGVHLADRSEATFGELLLDGLGEQEFKKFAGVLALGGFGDDGRALFDWGIEIGWDDEVAADSAEVFCFS